MVNIKAKAALAEVMRVFYEFGIPEDVKERDVAYLEKEYSATVVSGIRWTTSSTISRTRSRRCRLQASEELALNGDEGK